MASNTPTLTNCDICSEFYTDPRMLQCLHSFCVKCLKKLSKKQKALTCPTCEKSTSLPTGGVDALPKDLHKTRMATVAQYEIKLQGGEETACDRCVETSNGPAVSFCINCCEFLCKVCSKDHRSCRKTLSHELQPVSTSKGECQTTDSTSTSFSLTKIPEEAIKCQLHPSESLKFYCKTCNVLVCRDCITLKHSNHTCNLVEKVAQREKFDLLQSLGRADSACAKLNDAITNGSRAMEQILFQKMSVKSHIQSSFEIISIALLKRKEYLLAEAEKISLEKQTALAIQGEQFKVLHKEIANISALITQATQVYTPVEMLSIKAVMSDKLKLLLKQLEEANLEPCRSDRMQSSRLDITPISKKIESFGLVTGGSFPGEAKIKYNHKGVSRVESSMTIITCDKQGKLFCLGGEKVDVTIKRVGSANLPMKGKVVDQKNGTYVATFTPRTSGEYELYVTIDNQIVRGSPFLLHVQSRYVSLSYSQTVFCGLNHPYGVAVDNIGNVYVAAFSGDCIEVFKQNGMKVRTIGSSGRGYSQFDRPSDIAIQGDVLYVVEQGNERVQKFTTSGKFISIFAEGLQAPSGIHISNSNGYAYVSELNINCVSVFDYNGFCICRITDNLSNPWGLTFDPHGNLHVCNYGSGNVSVFTPEGRYISHYASQVACPAGIVIDEEGYIIVTEHSPVGDSHFSLLNPDRKLVRYVCLEHFNHLAGITMDTEGFIYVCSYYSNEVYKM